MKHWLLTVNNRPTNVSQFDLQRKATITLGRQMSLGNITQVISFVIHLSNETSWTINTKMVTMVSEHTVNYPACKLLIHLSMRSFSYFHK